MGSLFGGAPDIQKPKFKGAGTAALSLGMVPRKTKFEPKFRLTRTGDVLDLEEERQLFEDAGALGQGIAGLRSQLAPLRAPLLAGTAAARSGLQGLLGENAALRAQVQPGFGRLTQSLVESVRDREARSVGDLRSALTKRNILGSSFAEQEVRRTSLDFAQEEERARSEAFALEMAESRGLIDQASRLIEQGTALDFAELGAQLGLTQADAAIFSQQMVSLQQQQSILAQSVTRQLQELGFAANVAGQTQQIAAEINQANAAAAAQSAAGWGQLVGSVIGLGGTLGGASILAGAGGGAGGGAAGGGSSLSPLFAHGMVGG